MQDSHPKVKIIEGKMKKKILDRRNRSPKMTDYLGE